MSEGSKAPSKAEPKWKFIERTVAVLEHISGRPGLIMAVCREPDELM